jgi:hypothetical protein
LKRAESTSDQTAVQPLAASLLANLRSDAYANLTAVVDEALATRSERRSELRQGYLLHQGASALVERAKTRLRPLFPARLRMQQYSRGKFYGFSSADVPDRLRRVALVTGVTMKPTLHHDALLRLEA